MLGLLLRWIVGAVTLVLISRFVPGIEIHNWATALVAVIVIGLLNATLGLLLKVLTFPLSLLTLGLFLLVINAFVLIVASHVVPGFIVASFGSAFVAAIILALVHMLMGCGTRTDRRATKHRVSLQSAAPCFHGTESTAPLRHDQAAIPEEHCEFVR